MSKIDLDQWNAAYFGETASTLNLNGPLSKISNEIAKYPLLDDLGPA